MSIQLTRHYFATPFAALPPVDESILLDYVAGSNGVFARGRRTGLEVCMPVSFTFQPIRGLAEVASYAQWGYPKVPASLVETMLRVSREACGLSPREVLFYLRLHDCPEQELCHFVCAGGWHLEYPEQRADDQHVEPVHTGLGSSTERAVIEVHSHHAMKAEFSAEDNKDESQGFRIYCVIGTIFSKPEIRARVGLFGHFMEHSASEFFELPVGLSDCVSA